VFQWSMIVFLTHGKKTEWHLLPAQEPDPRHYLKLGAEISGFRTPGPHGIWKKVPIPLYRGKKRIPESPCAQPRTSFQQESMKTKV